MLRSVASQSHPGQGRAGLDRSPNDKIAGDYEALLRLLGHLVPSKVDSHVFTDNEKSCIYTNWIKAGKPHNLVCSECRSPDDLMLCETCCRSYHARCLPDPARPASTGNFYCPSCRDKRWDLTPPLINSLAASPGVSRSSTPVPPPAIMHSRTGLAAILSTQTSLQSSPVHSSPVDSQQQGAQNVLTMASSSDLMSRARHFLIQHGKFPTTQDFHPELLSNLGTMMLELESQQLLLQEIQDLREENASLRREALKTKHYYPSRMPINESALSSPSCLSPRIQTPSPDTAGKSWDRIVMDLI
ncbi:PHD finger protein [Aspergillus fumigatus Af293]|uniref:PHD finger protein n=2 Tax=Aspergillus fumigatus TaxID=746128 RepID=A4D9R1_ASPFU|nr:PHD finger protein [Aspergillus fumigatus Af293]EBA27370.1 PHD finger protein [Aspergillus fumigatus Af293]EDP55406.1 PHD finger protein [Aspergillus fumigatus A1163]